MGVARGQIMKGLGDHSSHFDFILSVLGNQTFVFKQSRELSDLCFLKFTDA